jgi:hypothetical protein
VLPEFITRFRIKIIKGKIGDQVEEVVRIIQLVLHPKMIIQSCLYPDHGVGTRGVAALRTVDDAKPVRYIAFRHGAIGDLAGRPPFRTERRKDGRNFIRRPQGRDEFAKQVAPVEMFRIIKRAVGIKALGGNISALAFIGSAARQQVHQRHGAKRVVPAPFELDQILYKDIPGLISDIARGREIAFIRIIRPLAKISPLPKS